MTAGAPAHAQSARPFPWGTLASLSREDVADARALHRWSSELVRAAEAAGALAALLDSRVEVIVRRIKTATIASDRADALGVLLAPGDEPEIARAVLVEVEASLGVALAARALRRHGPRVFEAERGIDVLAGPVAAILAAAARRVHSRRALRVLQAGGAPGLERALRSSAGPLIEASVTVIVNDDAFEARILVPRDVARAAPEPAWTRARLASLGDVPIALSVVAAASRSSAAEVGTLRRGDAWLPGRWPLRSVPGGGMEGPVLLAAPGSEVGTCALLGDDGRLVVREGVEALAWTPERSGQTEISEREEDSVTEASKDALIEAVGEVPVVVRVELGIAEMRAREWASLAPGDVVALGKRVGEAVTLRVGGVTVARGELVDLDGEVAVRILGRTDGETRTASQEQ